MAFNYQAIINSINNFAAQHGLTMYAYTANFKGVIEALDNLQNIQFSVQDGTIVNADVNINAAIDGTKISPNFGNQTLVTTGNVGVGTTSPSHGKLTLYDSASAPFNALVIQQGNTGSTASDGLHIGIDSAVDAYITHKENRAIAFGTANTERMRIDSSGNVGIGAAATVTSGGTTLQTTGSTFARMLLQSTNASGRKYGWYTDNTGIIGLYDYTATSERMRIDSSGNVGIGTTSPASLGSGFTEVMISGNTEGAGLQLQDTDGNVKGGIFTSDNSNTVTLRTITNHPLTFRTNNSERMRIDSSGNLGIGKSSDLFYRLTFAEGSGDASRIGWVSGSGNRKASIDCGNTAAIVFRTNVSDTERMRIDSSGDVEIMQGKNLTWVYAGGSTHRARIRAESSDDLIFENGSGNSERMRIDSSGRLLLNSGTDVRIELGTTGTTGTNNRNHLRGDGANLKYNTASGGVHVFEQNGSERMRIDPYGRVMIGTTDTTLYLNGSGGDEGTVLEPLGALLLARQSDQMILLNRMNNDGRLMGFYRAGTFVGDITVSGGTVSYNGGHLSRWSQLANGAERIEILRGSVLSNLDEMCEWGEEDNEQLNRMKVSDVEGDRNVAGVFQSWDDDDDTYTNDFYCAMTGDFVIRIAQGTTVARGDLLMSAGDGTAKPQDDDIVRSKTIAKVTSTTISETYSDGSYCVPCVLMAC